MKRELAWYVLGAAMLLVLAALVAMQRYTDLSISSKAATQGGTAMGQIVINIGIGLVASLLTTFVLVRVRAVKAAVSQRRLRAVLGSDVTSESQLHLVYAELALAMYPKHAETGTVLRHVYVKPGEANPEQSFSIERPISSCELRAVRYLAGAIGRQTHCAPALSSDVELKRRLDVSFVAFGGPGSNYKTRDLLDNDANNLVRFDGERFAALESGNELPELEQGYDYGLILKIHPTQFPARTWITCAGRGEWGTSGSAWYLATKWRDIQQWAGDAPFAIIVRVRPNQDESAQKVYRVSPTTPHRPRQP